MAIKTAKPATTRGAKTRGAANKDVLSLREQNFVLEYAIDYKAAPAAVRAGYSKASAPAVAKKLLDNPIVQKYVKRLSEKRQERMGIDEERIMAELAKMGFANMADYVFVGSNGDPYGDLAKLTRDQTAAIKEFNVEYCDHDFETDEEFDARNGGKVDWPSRPLPRVKKVTIKLHDKRAPLVDMGKQIGMWPSKREITGPNGGPIAVVSSEMTPKQAAQAYAEMIKAGA